MQKRIKIILENIAKAKDKNYVNDTIDSIIDSLHDFPYAVSNIGFHKDKDIFYVKFNLRICKTGDMVWCLIQEFLSCVVQTEKKVNVTIDSVEEGEVGITYKLYAYRSKEDEM